MKVHYINIFLFALPLNILAHNKNKPSITLPTPHTHTNRTLCECELYTPVNYDNDPQMKEVIENFNKQTQQRFEEYDERMKTTRQKCKDKCDKEIQKIILKDKLEKQMAEQFATLHTDIQSDSIPTCICKKSLADKTEKFCLNCGKIMGGVVPGLGLLCGYGAYELVKVAIAAAEKAAIAEGAAAGIGEGIKVALQGLTNKLYIPTINGQLLSAFINANNFNDPNFFSGPIIQDYIEMKASGIDNSGSVLSFIDLGAKGNEGRALKIISGTSSDIARSAGQAAERVTTETTKTLTLQKTAEATNVSAIFSNPIVISFIVVVIIIIMLLTIYLILRYRRKKKMKKKLQYIKLLEE
ncbi:rifin [Plasmodium reichenowi]|uniref:Rifin n=1 Tax=Plasmodium reichenowi TaxID=5854 RepID=A0A060RMD3_PLARE|nr:rifin [Plasmodium reichenowi]